MSSCALPSSDSAKRALDGEANGVRDLALSTLLRSALIAPGMMVIGIAPKKALLGSVVSSFFITTFIVCFMAANKGTARRRVRALRPAKR